MFHHYRRTRLDPVLQLDACYDTGSVFWLILFSKNGALLDPKPSEFRCCFGNNFRRIPRPWNCSSSSIALFLLAPRLSLGRY